MCSERRVTRDACTNSSTSWRASPFNDDENNFIAIIDDDVIRRTITAFWPMEFPLPAPATRRTQSYQGAGGCNRRSHQ
eukprot:6481304-Amphidinium_carterae.1